MENANNQSIETVPVQIREEILKGNIESVCQTIRENGYQNIPVHNDGDNLLADYIEMTHPRNYGTLQQFSDFLFKSASRKKTISALLAEGASPLQQNKYGHSAVYYAARYDDLTAMQLILSSLDNEKIKTLHTQTFSKKNTLLHLAVLHCSAKMVKLLLSYQFDPNVPDNEGNTPLHLLSVRHDTEAANAFFNVKGALKPDFSVRNQRGETVEQHNLAFPEIFSILNRERRKEILNRKKISYQERRLSALKIKARQNIRTLKRQREQMRRNASLQHI